MTFLPPLAVAGEAAARTSGRWIRTLACLGLAVVGGVSQAQVPLGPATVPLPAGVSRPQRQPLTGPAREARIELLRRRFADATAGGPMRSRQERVAFADLLKEWQELRRARALERAAVLGLAIRGELPGGRVFELVDLEGNRPRYYITTNVDAAIASNAAAVRSTAPFLVDGAGHSIGIWDGGAVRTTHQEFGGRVVVADGTTGSINHATHVGGTMVAAGVNASALGMAPAAGLISFDWNDDLAEMASMGATFPGEAGTIPLSNHSYSYSGGWAFYGAASYDWVWFGLYVAGAAQSDNIEDNFGQYSAESAALDAVVAGAPYYLPFFAAGNDRNDTPANGDSWRTAASGAIHTYTMASDPLADGGYKSGYDNLMFTAGAKNVLTVGAVTDADDLPGAPGGNRSVAAAAMSSFSSWGPSDDGRIKPDIVANGVGLTSSIASNNTAYTVYSGTSMASPNACGSAALLVDLFDKRFPGSAMRASTLKALIIHTADDLGAAGPDYQHGWGLMNTLAAAQLIDAHRLASGAGSLIEGILTSAKTSESFAFGWDGASPIRATLAWTDPAGAAKTGHDNRARALINDLDLLITGPTGTLHRPFVMPHVGVWTNASLPMAATTGTNTTDNVEQVLIAAPALPGTYTVSVTSAGALTGSEQIYSLVVSGAGMSLPAPAPTIDTLTAPLGCTGGDLLAEIEGSGFQLGANLQLMRGGHPAVAGYGPEVFTDRMQARFDLGPVAPGFWNLAVVNPDGQMAVTASAVEVPLTALEQDFEGSTAGWTTSASTNGYVWGLTTDLSASPVTAVFGPDSSQPSESTLISPPIAFPVGGACHRLSFKHWFDLEDGYDGGALEVTFDGTSWSDITSAGGTFVQGAYNFNLILGSNPINNTGRPVWSGYSGSFITTEVALDAATYSGQSVQFRWRLGCDLGTSYTGWVVDDVTVRVGFGGAWTAFEYWRHETTGDAFANETSDDDGDGKDLFAEYAFGSDPETSDEPTAQVGTADGYLTITFPVRLDATDVVFTVQTASALGAWIDAAVYTTNGVTVQRNGATNTVQVSVSSDGTRAIVTERNAIPIADEAQRFLRVVATRAGL